MFKANNMHTGQKIDWNSLIYTGLTRKDKPAKQSTSVVHMKKTAPVKRKLEADDDDVTPTFKKKGPTASTSSDMDGVSNAGEEQHDLQESAIEKLFCGEDDDDDDIASDSPMTITPPPKYTGSTTPLCSTPLVTTKISPRPSFQTPVQVHRSADKGTVEAANVSQPGSHPTVKMVDASTQSASWEQQFADALQGLLTTSVTTQRLIVDGVYTSLHEYK